VLLSYSQSYDPSGNIVQLTRSTGDDSTYTYDALNRLTAEDITGYGQIAYTYDATGNRQTKSDPVNGLTNYNYNEANQLTSTVGSETTAYSYNQNGALTEKVTGADTTTMSYNGMDKLTAVNIPGETVSYSYDPLGRRTIRVDNTVTDKYHLSGASDMAGYHTTDADTLSAEILTGADGLISYTSHGSGDPFTGYDLFNPHGDIAAITDTSGEVLYNASYDAFGNLMTEGALPYGYAGKFLRQNDRSADLIRMGVRDYDPALGRFISVDPLKGTPTDPQQRNRYTYTGNNPLVRYDLDGTRWVTGERSPQNCEEECAGSRSFWDPASKAEIGIYQQFSGRHGRDAIPLESLDLDAAIGMP
jgi:RHS repeat-associated protein